MSAIEERTPEEEEEDLDRQGYCPYTPHRRCTRGKEGGYSELALLRECFNPEDAVRIYSVAVIHFVQGFTYLKDIKDYAHCAACASDRDVYLPCSRAFCSAARRSLACSTVSPSFVRKAPTNLSVILLKLPTTPFSIALYPVTTPFSMAL